MDVHQGACLWQGIAALHLRLDHRQEHGAAACLFDVWLVCRVPVHGDVLELAVAVGRVQAEVHDVVARVADRAKLPAARRERVQVDLGLPQTLPRLGPRAVAACVEAHEQRRLVRGPRPRRKVVCRPDRRAGIFAPGGVAPGGRGPRDIERHAARPPERDKARDDARALLHHMRAAHRRRVRRERRRGTPCPVDRRCIHLLVHLQVAHMHRRDVRQAAVSGCHGRWRSRFGEFGPFPA